ncbi:MAG TPA: acetyl-CoA hydrolase/transferase C-terminal domain-containing protein [Syntrophomonadaceae bacterium]|nr:acetyl-CoA hydrolase/transferase C-terminal domain-containing protein [Syntrophomonadaceae bacterium]HRX20088.1 acetyl-CoA hydrolase/transferase C-terminal domain-containing protein [Syntrophomonadaceae bacterium]
MRNKYEQKEKTYSTWQEEYKSKMTSAEEIAKYVRNDEVVMLAGGINIPHEFSVELSKRAENLRNVTICLGLALKLYDYMQPQFKEHFRIETPFVGPVERMCLDWKTAEYIPVHLNQLAPWMEYRKPQIVGFSVTPPDENGYMNRSCFGGLVPKPSIEAANMVFAEVNNNLPWLNGDALKIHVSEIDLLYESDAAPTEIPEIPITDVERQIANYIAELIPNGATIQLGLGGLANAIGYFLKDKKDLGVHSEVIQNSFIELVQSGVVNNSKKTLHPGQLVATFCVGDKKLWDFCDHNKDFLFTEVAYNNDPYVIGKNDNLISVNNALTMDLTGQAGSESIRHRQYSGTGGQVNFVTGANFSKGGKSIMALNSTYKDKDGKLKSTIVPFIPPGTIVTTSRNDVEYIITEYGVVNLRYQGVSQRVKKMIGIAHPQFRDELTFQAKKIGWI